MTDTAQNTNQRLLAELKGKAALLAEVNKKLLKEAGPRLLNRAERRARARRQKGKSRGSR